MTPADRLIVALDLDGLEPAEQMVQKLVPAGVARFKIGLNLFTQAGPAAVEMVHRNGGKVFLDLKFHDIPNTVTQAVQAAARLGVWMANVHTQGGGTMMRQASAAANPILLIGVTVLTSMAEKDLPDLGINKPLKDQVLNLARLAKASGLSGVVASAREAKEIRQACGEGFLIVTPGIRPPGEDADDQQRTATPAEAIRAGADYLVVGRPILKAADPAKAARAILDECTRNEERFGCDPVK